MGGTRVGAAGLSLAVEIGLLLLSADFPALVVEDDVAFGATPFDAPGAAIEAVVQPGFVLPYQGVARELIEGHLGVGGLGVVVQDELAAAGIGAAGLVGAH